MFPYYLIKKWTKESDDYVINYPDDWECASDDLPSEVFTLSDKDSKVVCVPAGYANGLKALEPGSIILFLSDKVLSEALKDSWCYPPHKWNVF